MRLSISVIAALISIALSATCAAQAQPDSRFDGIWVGTEIVTQRTTDGLRSIGPPRTATTTIVIAQGGTMVGIIGGFCAGRFEHALRQGNTLNFGVRRVKISVSLSPDGKTLTENGSDAQVVAVSGAGQGAHTGAGYLYFQMSGTFHRQ